MIVEFRGVSKTYKKDLFKKQLKALDTLSVSFKESRCTALLGHNGAGKTTAIRSLMGLVSIDKGELLFKGRPLSKESKSQIGYMPEVNKLPQNLKVREVLGFHKKLYNQKHNPKDIEESLTQVGLLAAQNKMVKELSKGMARRLAWAQAISHDPTLLVLDEPFSGLDPVARGEMLSWIKGMKAQGKSIILCTHELWTIKSLCDDVNVFQNGKLAYSSLSGDDALVRSRYHLSLSGINLSQLETLKDEHMLPHYDIEKQDEFFLRIRFTSYEDALKWLKMAISRGLIVVGFSDELDVSDEFVGNLLRANL